MTTTSRTALIALGLAALGALLWLLLRDSGPGVGDRPGEVAAESGGRVAGEVEEVAASAPASRPLVSRSAHAPPARAHAAHRGVRGVVASPHVNGPGGAPGVDPAAWEAIVFALVDRPERRTVDRIGIARARPKSAQGDFEVALPVGRYMVQVEHRVPEPGGPDLIESWYAYAEIEETDRAPRDFGVHAFSKSPVRGVVREERPDVEGPIRIGLSDEHKDPGDPLLRGAMVQAFTSLDGRFAVSLARADGVDVVATVTAYRGSAEARREGVRPGEFVDLVLLPPEPEADVTFEIPWSPGMSVLIASATRRLVHQEAAGRAEQAVFEVRRRLPPSAYVIEVERSDGETSEWARAEVVVSHAPSQRIRVEPAFQPARGAAGRTAPKAVVTWLTRLPAGAWFERGSEVADDTGSFTLRGLPPTDVAIRSLGAEVAFPATAGAWMDFGDLDPPASTTRDDGR